MNPSALSTSPVSQNISHLTFQFMELFHKILKTAVAGGASDVHLKTGVPVVVRINRELLAIECPSPTEQWINKVVENVTPAHF